MEDTISDSNAAHGFVEGVISQSQSVAPDVKKKKAKAGQKKKAKVGSMRWKATTAADLPTIIKKLLEENVDDPVNTTIDMKLLEENVDSAFDTATTRNLF